MLFATAILIAGVLAAPGEIYRCSKPGGGATFQDRPCVGAPVGRSKDRLAAGDDPRALREWLSQYRHAAGQGSASGIPAAGPAASDVSPAQTASREPGGRPRPLDERQLAVCSERFYVCADGDGVRMDNCVAHMPQCGGGAGSSCCPAETLACYRDLRASGSTPAQAVRGALLGSGPACGP